MLLFKIVYKKLPVDIRIFLIRIFKFFLYKFRFFKLKLAIYLKKDIKIIIGAALTSQEGWYSTNEGWFDVSNSKHWNRLFNKNTTLSNVMSEHVFEHLTEQEMETSISLIHKYLKKNGILRIAVPDGNNPDPEYRLNTGINGIGPDAVDHKQFITYEFIKYHLEKIGFECEIKEGYLANGQLIINNIEDNLGYIMRSRSNSSNNITKRWLFNDASTSLIVDAIKL